MADSYDDDQAMLDVMWLEESKRLAEESREDHRAFLEWLLALNEGGE